MSRGATAPLTAVEDFGEYDRYLNSRVWPTSSRRASTGDFATKVVDDMPPQHAAAALCKLVRWAVQAPAGVVFTIEEAHAREDFVRSSTLGRALAARAQGLPSEVETHALYAEREVPRNHVIATAMVAISEAIPDREPAENINAALTVYDRITEHWKVVES